MRQPRLANTTAARVAAIVRATLPETDAYSDSDMGGEYVFTDVPGRSDGYVIWGTNNTLWGGDLYHGKGEQERYIASEQLDIPSDSTDVLTIAAMICACLRMRIQEHNGRGHQVRLSRQAQVWRVPSAS